MYIMIRNQLTLTTHHFPILTHFNHRLFSKNLVVNKKTSNGKSDVFSLLVWLGHSIKVEHFSNCFWYDLYSVIRRIFPKVKTTFIRGHYDKKSFSPRWFFSRTLLQIFSCPSRVRNPHPYRTWCINTTVLQAVLIHDLWKRLLF